MDVTPSCLGKLNLISLLSRVEELRSDDEIMLMWKTPSFKLKRQLSASQFSVLSLNGVKNVTCLHSVSGDDAADVINCKMIQM